MLKIVKMTVYLVLGGIVLLILIGLIWLKTSPEFGGSHQHADVERFKQSNQYKDGIFVNSTETVMDISFWESVKLAKEFFNTSNNRQPDFEIPVSKVDSLTIADKTSETQLIWFGHSAFLLQIEGKNILLDPMFGDVPAPHPWLGKNRYGALPIEVEQLPDIDAIILSHDHYDHLDYGSIQKLKDKTKQFFVPLGVGTHLRSWNIAASKIKELDWWDDTSFEGLDLIFAPARHFSGRGLTDRAKTLWGSWIIRSQADTLYFSGDSGYGPHFKEIGEKYGPFDFAMIECGQYNEKWNAIHMMPEESAQAGIDLSAKKIMPIHWGAFTLALHSWTDPVERIQAKAQELKLPLVLPKIGEIVRINDSIRDNEEWWVNNLKTISRFN